MSGLELGKAASAAGAWAWKLLENPFMGFLKRRWEDAKSESDKAKYLEARWKQFDWGKAAERYMDRMKANYGHIRVLGSTEPKSLDDLFTDVHILDKPQAIRRFDITELHKLQREPERLGETKRIPGLRVVVQPRGHRLYILGHPGAGKTTFLKYLVHQTMVAGLDKIPLFITIKDWADSGKDILDFIAGQFDSSLPLLLTFTGIFALAADDQGVRSLQPKLLAFTSRLQREAQDISEEAAQKLAELEVPGAGAPLPAWQQFHRQARALVLDYFGLQEEWQLSYEEFKQADRFIRANRLIFDCLEVAYVREREAILSKILTVE